ncbi:MAG: Transcriptional regulator, LysR family [uncultured Arthrobacter sp.]|uniref:Transcriptional regulator, LysR family n=1 Tax=uncultured Arthrobacter sp. TaxID=114050 RepID=A0A6J4ITK4_9MICC|nr:LysR family transcriptional regulator substrate-binding protein [uncultured Arthrobacter sp.]CAA9258491.1 MAG: Transcriptional regulator, LysR family [uncultured Arthrobacter sp.]
MPEFKPRTLSVGFVAGVTPGKWVGRWRERHPDVPLELQQYGDDAVAALHSAAADVLFVRLPVDRDNLFVIPLYEEQAVVVSSKEHEISLFDEVPLAELEAENLLEVEECGGPAEAVEVAASGAGVVVLPMSLARLHARRDAVHRPVPELPGTTIGIAWLEGNDSQDVEEFIGIVRGRTERSSRQPSAADGPEPRKSASQKASARKAAQQGSKKQAAPSGAKRSGAKPDPRKGSGKSGKPGPGTPQNRRGRRR